MKNIIEKVDEYLSNSKLFRVFSTILFGGFSVFWLTGVFLNIYRGLVGLDDLEVNVVAIVFASAGIYGLLVMTEEEIEDEKHN